MPLLFDDRHYRINVIGMPFTHAHAFKAVAMAQRCMIIVRATGPTCLQLLMHGYDTKGFRIHGKSCNWGPMAGFVMRDPRLNKSGLQGAQYNRAEHAESLSDAGRAAGWVASVTPLKIYEERREWLVQRGLIQVQARGNDRWEGVAVHPTGVRLHYSLIRDQRDPGLWGVYVDRARNGRDFQQERGGAVVAYDTKYGDLYEPLLAMTNPIDHRHVRRHDDPLAHLNAVTGDYDVFALWPYRQDYDPHGRDRRVLGTARAYTQRHQIENVRERFFTVGTGGHPFVGSQGTKLGNITDRIYEVAQHLNSVIGGTSGPCGDLQNPVPGRQWGPFPRRNVVWHSDEAARPFVDDVDRPLLAIAPSGLEIGIPAIADFRDMVDLAEQSGFMPTLAEGWTLNPTAAKPNRLGAAYARLVPDHWRGRQIQVPQWYNR